MNKRLYYIDVIKAIAIISVVLYHAGYMQYGYLGVDVFLVVNGFLLAKAFNELKTFKNGYDFIVKRLVRLYPLTLIATFICLIWGSYWMLPYQYQDLVQNVIATDLFCNNILMSVKSADYWNILNEYKPLMHTWYLGIIVQFYVVFTIILLLFKKIFRCKNNTLYIVFFCFILSLTLYLMPNFSITQKFYYLPFRVFEFCAGCLIAYLMNRINLIKFNKVYSTILAIIVYVLLGILLFTENDLIGSSTKLILTVVLTCILLLILPNANNQFDNLFSNKILVLIGKASFSIYIWHQIVFAFCRYSFTSDFNIKILFINIILISVVSFISYKFIEQKLTLYSKNKNGTKNILLGCISSMIILVFYSFYINSKSGVLRDVPELDIYKGKTTERMHISYNERIFKYDKDFVSNNKLHWVIIGDSYGRDFINILRESGIENKVEISYVVSNKYEEEKNIKRIKLADLIFITASVYPNDKKFQDFLSFAKGHQIKYDKIRLVGSKRFGLSLGQIYRYRNNKDYFEHTNKIEDIYFIENEKAIKKYGNHYIDLITPIRVSDTNVKVFTDNNKIISQDCEHLTQNGAKYYAKLLKEVIDKEIKL